MPAHPLVPVGCHLHMLRATGGVGTLSKHPHPFLPSFQLTVEMFDYLECELNLFQMGELLHYPGTEQLWGKALGRGGCPRALQLVSGLSSDGFQLKSLRVVLSPAVPWGPGSGTEASCLPLCEQTRGKTTQAQALGCHIPLRA